MVRLDFQHVAQCVLRWHGAWSIIVVYDSVAWQRLPLLFYYCLSPQGPVLAPYRGTPCPTMPVQPPKTLCGWQPTKVCKTQKRSQAGNEAHGDETPASTMHRP